MKPVGIEFMDLIIEGMKQMPKQSREQIIGELNARKIGYSEDMSYNELCELLKQAQDAELEHLKAEAGAVSLETKELARKTLLDDEPIDYSNVRCGLSTIQDFHRRITILERLIANLLARPPVPIMIQGKDAK